MSKFAKRIETTFAKEVLFRNTPPNVYPGTLFRATSVEQHIDGRVVLRGYGNASKSCIEEYGRDVVEHEKTPKTALTDAGVDIELWRLFEVRRLDRKLKDEIDRAEREKKYAADRLVRNAAPELLDALQRVLRHIPANAGGASLSDDIHIANKAIAKAIGV